MSEWKEYKLGDLADIFDSQRIPLSSMERQLRKGIFPYYGASGIIDYVNEYIFDGNYLLISEDGENLNSRQTPIAFEAKGKFWINNHAHIIKGKKDYLNKLVQYYLAQLDLSPFITGAVQPKLSQENLLSISFDLPSTELEQRAIASILSSLDDKIDLLHLQNKTLEQLAETLFRQWFVEEAVDSWEVGTLENEFDFTMGQSPPGDSYNEIGNGIIFFQGRTDYDFRFPKARMYTTKPSRYAKQFDTLISVRAPVGDMNMAYNNCCIGRGLSAFCYKHEPTFYSYTYYKLRSLIQQIKQFEDNGTVFGSITKNDFSRLENIIPPAELINNFQINVKPIDEKIFSNYNQISILTQLRDKLLPKLMSGEVRVS